MLDGTTLGKRHHNWRAIGTCTGHNRPLSQDVLHLFLHLILLRWPKSVWWSTGGFAPSSVRISCKMSLFGGRPLGSVSGNTSLNSSTSSFNFPRTSRSTLDRISSSRSSNTEKTFLWADFFHEVSLLPFNESNGLRFHLQHLFFCVPIPRPPPKKLASFS